MSRPGQPSIPRTWLFVIFLTAFISAVIGSSIPVTTVSESGGEGHPALLKAPSEFGDTCSDDRDLQLDECGGKLVCRSGVCTWCTASEQCLSGYECKNAEEEGTCEREPLFANWRATEDTATTFLLFLGASLAAGGGVGGGGIFVPIYIIVAGLTPQEAVPMSQATIMGGSIANLINYYPKFHPKIPGKPLIDYEVVMMLTPMLLVGTTIGVILNTMFPGWLIVALLALTLIYTCYRTTKKAIRAWRTESESRLVPLNRRGSQSAFETSSDFPSPNSNHALSGGEEDRREKGVLSELELVRMDDGGAAAVSEQDGFKGDAEAATDGASRAAQEECRNDGLESGQPDARLAEVLRNQNRPFMTLTWIAAVWAIFLVVSLLRGGKAGSASVAGVDKCDTAFWILTWGIVPFLGFVTWAYGRRLRRWNAEKVELGWVPIPGEIQWNMKNTQLYPAIATLAGVMGGLLGIGGGMIMGPLLLELGIDPRATSATSASAVFLTASSAAVQFLIMELLILDWAGWYACVGFLATVFGLFGINHLVRRYNRASFIVICIALIIFVATIMMVTSGIMNLVEDIDKGRSLGFKDFC